MSTSSPKPAELTEQWYLVDAKGRVLGRLATVIATLLRGKHQPQFAPHVPGQTHVVVINAAQVTVTGNKLEAKQYYRHSGKPGNLQSRNLGEEMKRHPTKPLEKAVFGMLPTNKLRSVWMNHLHVYPGADHPHQAQKPEEITPND